MELFLEFSMTLFLSILFSFIVSKLLSDSSTTFIASDDNYLGGAFNGAKFARSSRKVRASKPGERVGRDKFSRRRFSCSNVRSDDGSLVAARPTVEEEETLAGKIPNFTEAVMGLPHPEDEFREKDFSDEIEMLDLGGEAECEIVEVSECGGDDVLEMGWVNADQVFDEWEGVERSELERLFGAALAYVGCCSTSAAADSSPTPSPTKDLKLQLYGLHKIAIDGPCRAPQPMALKVSARAKWNSWQQLGDMDRDEAMEHYINLLSNHIPKWRETLLEESGKKDFPIVEMNTNFELTLR